MDHIQTLTLHALPEQTGFRRDFVLHSVGISQDVLDTDTVMSFIQLPLCNTFICQKNVNMIDHMLLKVKLVLLTEAFQLRPTPRTP